jgi:hypothetical protein
MSEASVFRIDTPGNYGLSDEDYLADPVVVPSLNNTTIRNILVSPAHAWAAHPRLGAAPDAEWDSTDAQDLGHVAHAMFLLGENKVRVLNVENFKTNKARDMRDAAIAEGRIPLKLSSYENVRRVVDKLEAFRLRTGAFTLGKPEQTLIWTEDKEWGRCKVDWLPDEPSAYLWDLKTTTGLANAATFGRSPFGYDTQAVWYCRGAECVRGEPPEGMRFCVIETKPPYGIKVFEFTPAAIGDAQEEVHEALQLWKRCRETDTWPTYPDDVEWIDLPPWTLRDRAWRRQSGRGLAREPRPAGDQAAVNMMLNTGNLGG